MMILTITSIACSEMEVRPFMWRSGILIHNFAGVLIQSLMFPSFFISLSLCLSRLVYNCVVFASIPRFPPLAIIISRVYVTPNFLSFHFYLRIKSHKSSSMKTLLSLLSSFQRHIQNNGLFSGSGQ